MPKISSLLSQNEFIEPSLAHQLVKIVSGSRGGNMTRALSSYEEESHEGQDGSVPESGSSQTSADVSQQNAREMSYGGRRHVSWTTNPEGEGKEALSAWLGRATSGEAASVHSFRQLAVELNQHGAPIELIQRAQDALRDEVNHTRVMLRLAQQYGGSAKFVRMRPMGRRSLLLLALENAREACVNETFAALVAVYQSETAMDPAIRTAMRQLATDELQHAQFAWDLHSWFMTQLNEEEVIQVEEMVQKSLNKLARTRHHAELSPVVLDRLGLPNAQTLPLLIQRLSASLLQQLHTASRS